MTEKSTSTSNPTSNPTGIGASVRRKEDDRFLRGVGCYGDDLPADGAAHMVVVRTPHAHARLGDINTALARSAPGVLALLTAVDLENDGVGVIPALSGAPPFDIRGRDGATAPEASQYPLAREKTRYAGEAVAVVVAETLAQARDAADLVDVVYTTLPAVTTIEQAANPDSALIWEEFGSNQSIDWAMGDEPATAAAFAAAAHIARLDFTINRIAPVFLEPRTVQAHYDAAEDRFLLQAGVQSPHRVAALLALILDHQQEKIRVLVPDMGGGFGARGGVYPEFILALVAARRLGRPVRWRAERGESYLTDFQARDQLMRGELAFDEAGRMTALRADIDWRHGAYFTPRNVFVMIQFLQSTIGGVYRIPMAHIALRGLFSNTTPQSAFRGVGRMEANYLIESLVDVAARDLDRDAAELRRINLVRPDEMPWQAAGGNIYTSGEFEANMDRALSLADHAGFAARRAADEAVGRLRGFGLALYVENDGSTPTEFAEVEAHDDGTVTVYAGTQDFGMGHHTMYSQIISEQLGIAFEAVHLVNGDTQRVHRGSGTHGSRSARMGGTAAVMGAEKMIEKGREIAADLLETAPADITYGDGQFTVTGTDRHITLAAVAAHTQRSGGHLSGDADFNAEAEAHANGCYACEVSIDRETGAVLLETFIMVADVGRAINPMIVHGQLHGGAAQGIGQALMEQVVLDQDSGQTLTGSMMDYRLPRADDLPGMIVELNEIIEADNPLGVKGVGESAATGAPAVVMNAVRDALASGGGGAIDMPATPEKIWRSLQDGK